MTEGKQTGNETLNDDYTKCKALWQRVTRTAEDGSQGLLGTLKLEQFDGLETLAAKLREVPRSMLPTKDGERILFVFAKYALTLCPSDASQSFENALPM